MTKKTKAKNQFELLGKRKFLPIFLTQFLGAFNDNVFKNALIVLLTYGLAERAGFNPQTVVTLAAGIFIAPMFLFSSIAGQIADKFAKSSITKYMKLIEITLMLTASIGFFFGSVWILMITLFCMGLQSTFFGPVKYSILPEYLTDKELLGGNALVSSSTFLSILLGSIVGGLLIMVDGGIFIISAIVLLCAVSGYISSLFMPTTKPTGKSLKLNLNIFSESYKIMKNLTNERAIALSALGISWFWFVGSTFIAQFPNLARYIIGGNEQVVTLFLAMFSVGIALGSLLCNKILKGAIHATFVPLAAIGMSIFMLDLYFVGSNLVNHVELIGIKEFFTDFTNIRVAFDLFMVSIFGGMYIVPLYALIQQRSKPSQRSRNIAALNIMNALFMTVSAFWTLSMFKLGFGIVDIFLFLSLINLLVAVRICKILPGALLRSIGQWLMKALYRVEVRGFENYLKTDKKAVIVANHTSFLDAALLTSFLPGDMIFAIDTQIAEKWWIKPFLKVMQTYKIDPTNPMSIKSLINLVKEGKRVVIFPEGRITVTGALMKIYEGPGMIADKADAQILPIRINGAQLSPFSRLRGKIKIKKFPKITLDIVEPQRIKLPAKMRPRDRRYEAGNKLYDIMSDLMFKSSNYQQTLFESLLDAKNLYGKKHIVMEDVNFKPVNYQQLITKSFVLGNYIAKDTESSEYIGVLMPNSVAGMTIFFSMHTFNRVPVMLNFSAGSRNILSACKTTKIRHIYTSREFVERAKLTETIEVLKNNEIEIKYLEDLKGKISLKNKLFGFIAGKMPKLSYSYINRNNKPDHNSPAVTLFTSGSEGDPKGVVLSHTNIQANRYQLSSGIDFSSKDIVFNVLPIFHSFGLSSATLLPILSGIKVFLYPTPLHYRIVPELIYRTNATMMFGTNTFMTGYAKYAHPYDFYSLRYAFAGAEKLKPEIRRIWSEKFGVRIFEGYGATETAPVISFNTPMKNRPGSVGRVLPGIEYKVRKVGDIENGGKLFVKGPNVMLGYLFSKAPCEIKGLENGWYDTGDIVELDSEGYVSIQGRMKRFAKIAGEMVSMSMIEEEVTKIYPDSLNAIISKPDEKKGERLILVSSNSKAERKDIMTKFREVGITELAIPKEVIYMEKLPLLGTGKVDYMSLNKILKE